jgi:hydroxymethylpyrimidine/phosphomethylpyrimidine kinase
LTNLNLLSAQGSRDANDQPLGIRCATMTAIAVTIAGSDSSGGAGIQADLKTFSALGVYGASVIAALTAQNTQGVSAIHDVPPDFITAQIDAVFSDLAVDAVKIGMLSTPAAIEAVAEGLDRYGQKKIVLDPVMVAATGARLLVPEAVETLKRRLFPRARLITPNLPEAAALLDIEVATNEAEMHAQADRLLALGAQAVLIKGGHGSGTESVDLLVERAGIARFVASRIATENSHGSGCTLSAAIAAGLAKGAALGDAVGAAKDFISRAIAAANRLAIGSGHGPVHHLHAWW